MAVVLEEREVEVSFLPSESRVTSKKDEGLWRSLDPLMRQFGRPVEAGRDCVPGVSL